MSTLYLYSILLYEACSIYWAWRLINGCKNVSSSVTSLSVFLSLFIASIASLFYFRSWQVFPSNFLLRLRNCWTVESVWACTDPGMVKPLWSSQASLASTTMAEGRQRAKAESTHRLRLSILTRSAGVNINMVNNAYVRLVLGIWLELCALVSNWCTLGKRRLARLIVPWEYVQHIHIHYILHVPSNSSLIIILVYSIHII